MGSGQLSARMLDASYGPVLQEINRACPVVSDFTFWFDRGEDFFRWPGLVYDLCVPKTYATWADVLHLVVGSVPRLVPGQVGGPDPAEGATILGLWA